MGPWMATLTLRVCGYFATERLWNSGAWPFFANNAGFFSSAKQLCLLSCAEPPFLGVETCFSDKMLA